MTRPTRLVTDAAELARTCDRLARGPFVAVDTEFLRDRTYYARLCLVQLGNESEHVVVDPLAVRELEPLRELLLAPGLVKVLHASRQDLEIFHDLWGAVPAPVFDTQLAATVLGFGDQAAYGALVREVLGVQLDKAHTLTDWARRPLTPEQVAYASADVVHLAALYGKLCEMLETRGRGEWLALEMAALTDPALYQPDPQKAWETVRGAGGLRGSQQAIARELAAWREIAARSRDLPRRWVLADDAVVAIARRSPRTVEDLVQLRGVGMAVARRDGFEILAAIGRGREAAPQVAPEPPRMRPEADALAVADLLASVVRLRARDRGVSAGTLASRGELEKLAVLGEDAGVPALSGWRREVVGEDLLALRAGRLRLVVREGAVVVEPAGEEPPTTSA